MSQEITEYLTAAAIFIALIIIFTWKSYRLKQSGWSGIVESVRLLESSHVVTDDEDGSYVGRERSPINDKYILILRLDNGASKKAKIPRLVFPGGVSRGDRITKLAGSYDYRIDRK